RGRRRSSSIAAPLGGRAPRLAGRLGGEQRPQRYRRTAGPCLGARHRGRTCLRARAARRLTQDGSGQPGEVAVNDTVVTDVVKQFKWVGTRPIRPDGVPKVTGRAMYGADYRLPGMLFGRILRSPHAHARIRSIDT